MFMRVRFMVGALMLIGAMSITACSKDGDSGATASGGDPQPDSVTEPVNQPEPVPVATPHPAADIMAQWESNCMDADLFGLSMNSRLEMMGEKISKLTRYHTNGGCAATGIEITQAGSFAKGAEVSPGVVSIDFHVAEATVKPVSNTGVDILKLSRFCGISDWQLNKARDITTTGGERCIPKLPVTIFDIYSLEGNKLYFGRGDNLTNASKRPKELNRDLIYSRQ